MANTFLTNAEISYEAAAVFYNNLMFVRKITRESPHKRGGGPTVSVRKPPRYTVSDGRLAVPQDIGEQYVDLTLNYRKNIAMSFNSEDRTLSMDNFRERYITPAVAPIANQVDRDALVYAYPKIFNAIGTPGTVPNTLLTYNLAGAKLLDHSTVNDGRWSMLIDPTMQATIASVASVLFTPSSEIDAAYRHGEMGRQGNFNYAYDQNIVSHTVGALGGTPLINNTAGVQTGSSLVTDGWSNSITNLLLPGDVFTIGTGATGVYAVNPVSLQSTGKLAQFVVTAAVNSDGSGNATIPISPSITLTGAFQTVVAGAADGAAITVLGAANTVSPQGIGFHPSAMVAAFADLDEPYTGNSYFISDEELGIAMRVWEFSDGMTDTHAIRLDVWYGFAMIYPEWMVRVAS